MTCAVKIMQADAWNQVVRGPPLAVLGCEVPATTNDHRSQIARRMQGIQPVANASMMHVTPCTCQRTVYSEGSELRALAVQFFAEGFQSSNSEMHCCWSDKLSGQSSFSHPKARRNATRVKETQADVPSKCNLWGEAVVSRHCCSMQACLFQVHVQPIRHTTQLTRTGSTAGGLPPSFISECPKITLFNANLGVKRKSWNGAVSPQNSHLTSWAMLIR